MADKIKRLRFTMDIFPEIDDAGNPYVSCAVKIGSCSADDLRLCVMDGSTKQEAEVRAFKQAAIMLQKYSDLAEGKREEIEKGMNHAT